MKKSGTHIFMPHLLALAALFGLFAGARSQDNPKNAGLVSRGDLKIGEITVNTLKPGLYEKFEISFSLTGDWDNPFDPDQVTVEGRFYCPDGKQMTVPGFYYQDYRENSYNSVEKTGEPVWKIRFAPVTQGEYRYEVIANNKGKEAKSSLGSFTAVSFNVSHGFLKVSKTNPLYFEYDDGYSFFAVAMDNAVNSYFNYMRIYPRFAKAGGNYNRLFIMSGDLDLGEELRPGAGPEGGLGKINLDAAWKLDKVIEKGEELGIYHQMCMTNQYNFNVAWKNNVFNKANGGILDSPTEYFTSEPSMKYLEKRFRYIIARWGYSTAVFSWNLWNEYSAQPGFDIPSAVAWHRRMAAFISSIDPFSHVIHTNDGRLNGVDEVSSLPEMEVITTNTYGIKNIADVAGTWTRKFISTFHKPYLLAEFGIGHTNLPPGGYGEVDPERRMIHDGLWSPLVNGSAGTGMVWEWQWTDNEVFYTFIKAVSKIVRGVPFNRQQWQPVSVSSFRFKNEPKEYYSDVIFEGWDPTGNYGMPAEAENHKIFVVDKSGKVSPNEYLHSYLEKTHDSENTGTPASVTFRIEFPAEGEFLVYVSDVRSENPGINLKVSVDGKVVLNKEVPKKPFMHYFPIKIGRGSHTIVVENDGEGSFQTAFELKNYRLMNGPDLEVRGLQSDRYILLWIKNQKYTLLHELSGIGHHPQPEGILELQDVPDGQWVAEWVNTTDSRTIRTELITAKNGKLVLYTPEVRESVAIRLQRMEQIRAD